MFCLVSSGVLEVIKGMQMLGVSTDTMTFDTYILPTFPNVDSAAAALKVERACVCVERASATFPAFLLYFNNCM